MKPGPHGQPPERMNFKHRANRDMSEMLGIVRGILYDGIVTDEEVRGLTHWADSHEDVVSAWPVSVIYERIRSVLEDGVIDDSERQDLKDLFVDLVGGSVRMVGGQKGASRLPLDRPAPTVEIPDRVFVLTGRFAYGPRRACEEATKAVGGWCEPNVTLRTDFVVIGTFASRDWAEASYGRKVEKAVDYRERHGRPHIIAEDHWARSI